MEALRVLHNFPTIANRMEKKDKCTRVKKMYLIKRLGEYHLARNVNDRD